MRVDEKRRVARSILANAGLAVPAGAVLPGVPAPAMPVAQVAVAAPAAPVAQAVELSSDHLPRHLQKLWKHLGQPLQQVLHDGGTSHPHLHGLVQVVVGKSPVATVPHAVAGDEMGGALMQLARLHGPEIRIVKLPSGEGFGVGHTGEVQKLLENKSGLPGGLPVSPHGVVVGNLKRG